MQSLNFHSIFLRHSRGAQRSAEEPSNVGHQVVVCAAPELKADVERRVRSEIGLEVESWTRVSGGAQNRLFQLSTREGTQLLLKQYAIDRWPRLPTEFSTLRALNSQGLERVPRALLRDDERSLRGVLLRARQPAARIGPRTSCSPNPAT
jgi:hypothetical protein